MAGQVYRYTEPDGKVLLTDQRRGKPAPDPALAALDELVEGSRRQRSDYPDVDYGPDPVAEAKAA